MNDRSAAIAVVGVIFLVIGIMSTSNISKLSLLNLFFFGAGIFLLIASLYGIRNKEMSENTINEKTVVRDRRAIGIFLNFLVFGAVLVAAGLFTTQDITAPSCLNIIFLGSGISLIGIGFYKFINPPVSQPEIPKPGAYLQPELKIQTTEELHDLLLKRYRLVNNKLRYYGGSFEDEEYLQTCKELQEEISRLASDSESLRFLRELLWVKAVGFNDVVAAAAKKFAELFPGEAIGTPSVVSATAVAGEPAAAIQEIKDSPELKAVKNRPEDNRSFSGRVLDAISGLVKGVVIIGLVWAIISVILFTLMMVVSSSIVPANIHYTNNGVCDLCSSDSSYRLTDTHGKVIGEFCDLHAILYTASAPLRSETISEVPLLFTFLTSYIFVIAGFGLSVGLYSTLMIDNGDGKQGLATIAGRTVMKAFLALIGGPLLLLALALVVLMISNPVVGDYWQQNHLMNPVTYVIFGVIAIGSLAIGLILLKRAIFGDPPLVR